MFTPLSKFFVSRDELDATYEALKRPSYDSIISYVAVNTGREPEDVDYTLSYAVAKESGKSRFDDYYKANGWTIGELIVEARKRRAERG